MCKNWWLRAHASVSNSRSNVINKVKKGLCDCMEFCHHFRCSLAEKQATGLHSTVVSIERVNSNMMFKAKKSFKGSTQMFLKTLIQTCLRTLKKLYQKTQTTFLAPRYGRNWIIPWYFFEIFTEAFFKVQSKQEKSALLIFIVVKIYLSEIKLQNPNYLTWLGSRIQDGKRGGGQRCCKLQQQR